MEVFIGSIMTFGFQFAPSGWQGCNGQTLNLQQYTALFTLIGITYGGNGTQNFMLPNLQGRLPLGQGTGANLTTRILGTPGGAENVNILIGNMPAHTHVATFTPSGGGGGNTYMVSTNAVGNSYVPSATNNVLAGSPAGPTGGQIWATSSPAPTIPLGGLVSGGGGGSGGTVINASTGNSLPTAIMNPFLVLNFSIALQGIFPSHN
jgi:microcystin-dependent protein